MMMKVLSVPQLAQRALFEIQNRFEGVCHSLSFVILHHLMYTIIQVALSNHGATLALLYLKNSLSLSCLLAQCDTTRLSGA